MTFNYNALNLLSVVKENNAVKASYRYLADGTKTSVRNGNGNTGYDYEGSFVYTVTNNIPTLEAAHFVDGQLKATGVNYTLTDHLGSVRALVDANGTLLEQNDYYPFGSQHVNVSYASSDNRYTFSGKESQDLLDLNTYDFGARMYDGGLNKWWQVDPMNESYYSTSPYAYCAGIPIRAIDFQGKLIIFINGFHNGFEGASSRYWDLGNGRNFDIAVQSHFKDYKVRYYDGSLGGIFGFSTVNGIEDSRISNLVPRVRYKEGYRRATSEVETIMSQLKRDSNGQIIEPIRIVTHSMGGIYGKGFAQALIDFVTENPYLYNGLQITEYDFAPYDSQEQKAVRGVDTYQYSHKHDDVAHAIPIVGSHYMPTSQSEAKGHSIKDFYDYIDSLPEGKYKFVNGKFVTF